MQQTFIHRQLAIFTRITRVVIPGIIVIVIVFIVLIVIHLILLRIRIIRITRCWRKIIIFLACIKLRRRRNLMAVLIVQTIPLELHKSRTLNNAQSDLAFAQVTHGACELTNGSSIHGSGGLPNKLP